MCGITGIFAYAGGQVRAAEIGRMADRLVHRGPDDAGFLFADEGGVAHFGRDFDPGSAPAQPRAFLGFGHRRLSIIDLAGGHQPMGDPVGQVWLSYNGELYNYRALRHELERRGRTFRTASDTEV